MPLATMSILKISSPTTIPTREAATCPTSSCSSRYSLTTPYLVGVVASGTKRTSEAGWPAATLATTRRSIRKVSLSLR